jgi:hypothetical protein
MPDDTDVSAADVSAADVSAAERLLAGIPEFAWLTGSKQQWWTVDEVSDKLGIGPAAVRSLIEHGDIAGAVLYGTRIGWRLPRSGLLVYLARLRREAQGRQASQG